MERRPGIEETLQPQTTDDAARLRSQLADVEQALREARSADVRLLLREMRASLLARIPWSGQDEPVETVAASTFPPARLARLFTDAYEGYFMPVAIDEAAFTTMGTLFDYDLDASRVAVEDGEPVGLALLGRRGNEGWIGGVGVVPARRRGGLGRVLMEAVTDEARAHGMERLQLEVLEQNAPAIALYESLGWQRVRDLEVWSLASLSFRRHVARAVPAAQAHARIRAARTWPEPWQRSDATVANSAGVEGLESERAALLYRLAGDRVSLLQGVAEDEEAAREILHGFPSAAAALTWLNGPAGDPFNAAIAELGGTLTARQHEYLLDL